MYLCVDKIPTKPSILLNATDVETMFVLIKLICSQIWPMFSGVQHYTFTRLSGGVILISLLTSLLTGYKRAATDVEIGFWPDFGRRIPPPPSMPPHLPTLAHPPTRIDFNNPDCHLLGKKKSPGPFFLYIERFYLFIYTSYEYVCIHTWIMFAFLIIN